MDFGGEFSEDKAAGGRATEEMATRRERRKLSETGKRMNHKCNDGNL